MTRDEALSVYQPARAGIQRVLKAAVDVCSQADLKRAAKHLGVWWDDRIVVEDDTTIDMVADIALLELNQRKRRAYDRYLESEAHSLDPTDLDLAGRMASAFFSIFKVLDRHPSAGIWVEDVVDGNRRIWILDEGLENSAPVGLVFGMRLFDVGPFHAGFGIVVPVDEEIAHYCTQARAQGDPLPVRDSLAATLYGDALRARAPLDFGDEEILGDFLDLLIGDAPNESDRVARPRAGPKRRSGPQK